MVILEYGNIRACMCNESMFINNKIEHSPNTKSSLVYGMTLKNWRENIFDPVIIFSSYLLIQLKIYVAAGSSPLGD